MFPDAKNPEIARKYPFWGSLLSYTQAYLSKIFNAPLEKIAWYMVPIFSVLFVIPLFLYLKNLNYPYAGFIGALVGVSSIIYLGRTTIMRLDTDCLNLFFPFFIAYTFLKFVLTPSQKGTYYKKYFWIFLGGISLLLYKLWYSPDQILLALVLSFVFYYLIQFFITRNKEVLKEGLIGFGIILIFTIWYLPQAFLNLLTSFYSLVFGIKKTTYLGELYKDFPNILQSISELTHSSFEAILGKLAIFNFAFGFIGLIGAILFFILRFKNAIFLLPIFGVGLVSFVSGNRFVMYLSPFIGIGIGFLCHFLIEKVFPLLKIFSTKKKQEIIVHVLGVFLLIVVFILQSESSNLYSQPKVTHFIVRNMDYIKNHTPSNAVIWTWWDYGYAFQYYSRRATFHDGGSQTTPKTYFIARSFATTSFEEAWNITAFLSHYGLSGIKSFLENGTSAKKLVHMVQQGTLSPPLSTPVYWVFTQDLISKFAWIHYFGTFDFDTKKGTFESIFVPPKCRPIVKKVGNMTVFQGLACEKVGNIDLNLGVVKSSNKLLPIKTFYYREYNKNGELTKRLDKDFFEKGLIVIWIKREGVGNFVGLCSEKVANTVFVKMFLLQKYDPKYFTLIKNDFPFAVIYKVNPVPKS